MYKHIPVPTDGSSLASKAAPGRPGPRKQRASRTTGA